MLYLRLLCRLGLALACFAPLGLIAQDTAPATPPAPPAAAALADIRIVLKTTKGDIAATLFASKVPMTAANFLNLAQKGFYNGLTFHRK